MTKKLFQCDNCHELFEREGYRHRAVEAKGQKVRYCSNECRVLHNRPNTKSPEQLQASFTSRFWERVNKTPGLGPKGDCWHWIGQVSKTNGYGYLRIGTSSPQRTHRLSYQLEHGVVLSKDDYVLHSCDNRICVNSKHLRLGTHEDNMNDRNSRQRTSRGEAHHCAKFKEDQVLEIRRLYDSGEVRNTYELAKIFGVRQGSIWNIVARKTWKHI